MRKICAAALVLSMILLCAPVYAFAAQPALTAIESDGSTFRTREVSVGQNLSFTVSFRASDSTQVTIQSVTLLASEISTLFTTGASSYVTSGAFYSFDFPCRSDAAAGSYHIPFSVRFTTSEGDFVGSVSVPVNIKSTSGGGSENNNNSGGGYESPVGAPKITITSFTTDPDPVEAGGQIKLTVTIKNNGQVAAVNMKVTYTSDGTFTPISGASSFYIDRIGAGSTRTQTISLKVKGDVSPGSYTVTFDFAYDVEGSSDTANDRELLAVPVIQVPKIKVSSIQIAPETPTAGNDVSITAEINNVGKSRIYNVAVEVYDNNKMIETQSQYIGTIEPGASGTIDLIVAVLEAGTVKLQVAITFENENADLYSETISSEFVSIEKTTPDPDNGGQGTNSKPLVWPFIVGAIVLLGGAGAAVLIIWRRNKKDADAKRDRAQIREIERQLMREENENPFDTFNKAQ